MKNILAPSGNNKRKGGVNIAYVMTHLTQNPIRYLLTNNSNRVIGIALLKNERPGIRRLNTMAVKGPKGSGRLLLNKIIKNAIENNKTRMNLNAHPGVINFYKKLGFKPYSAMAPHGLKPMTQKIKNVPSNNNNWYRRRMNN